MSEYSIDNNSFLDRARLKNFSKIIEGLSRDDFATLQEEYPKELILENILKLKDKKCFSNDSELTIMSLIEEKIQRIEAQEEILLIKYKGLIDIIKEDLSEGEEPNINRDYGKLYEFIKKDNLDINLLENDNESLKLFLDALGIDWKHGNPKEEIKIAYKRMENENIELPQNINSNYKDNQRIDKIKQEQRENLEDEKYQDGFSKIKSRKKN